MKKTLISLSLMFVLVGCDNASKAIDEAQARALTVV